MRTRNQKIAWLVLLIGAIVCGLLTVVFSALSRQATEDRASFAATSEWLPIIFFATGTLQCLSALGVRAHTGKLSSLYTAIACCSCLALLAQGGIWWLLAKAERQQVGIGTAVLNAADTDSYLKDNLPPGRDPMRVRTGVFVEAFDFLDANTIEIRGYIWQRYSADVPKDLVRGFVLPEAANAYETTEAYHARDARTGEETIGWYFNARLRQSYPYEKYPFDRQDIRLRMWHKDFNRGAILIPDFDAYGDMRPSLLPGVEAEFVREGWENEYACYSYNKIRYNSNFGFGTFRDRPPLPELYFNIGIKRAPGSIVIRRVIPLFIVACLLFGVSLILVREGKWRELTGNDAFAVLAFCLVLFIALAADHIQLRGMLAANTFIYAECGYIILYMLLLILSLCACLLAARRPVPFLEYENGVALPLFFWPVLLGLLLTTTVITFGH